MSDKTKDKDLKKLELGTSPPEGFLKFDPDEWLPYLDGVDMTEAQKIEYLEALWNMMFAFVDQAWNGEKGGS